MTAASGVPVSQVFAGDNCDLAAAAPTLPQQPLSVVTSSASWTYDSQLTKDLSCFVVFAEALSDALLS